MIRCFWGDAAGLRQVLLAVVALVYTLSLPASAGGDAFADEKRAVLLTVDNFDAHVQEKRDQHRPLLVMFHVSWCKVCQRSFPEFAAASDKVHERNIGIDFAHVDCTNQKTLCTRFSVKGYPSIKLFSPDAKADAEPRSFSGQRNERNFVRYAERMMMAPIQSFSSRSDFEKALSNETFSAYILAVQAGSEPSAAVVSAAEKWMDRHLFASVRNLGDLLPQDAPKPPAEAQLAVLSIGGQQWPGKDNTSASPPAVVFYSGDIENSTAVSQWIARHRFPGVWKLGETNFYEFTHASRPTVILAADSAAMSEADETAMRGAASELGEEYFFGFVDGNAWSEELADFNVHKKDLPRILITEDNFDSWIEDIDLLTLRSLASDLRKLLGGAPILRQDRGAMTKFKFYHREALRTARQMKEYASKGLKETCVVCAAVGLGGMVLLMALWCIVWVLRLLLSDPDPDWEPPRGYPEHLKRR